MERREVVAGLCAALVGLSGCGAGLRKPTKAEMLTKVAGKTKKGELRAALGEANLVERIPGAAEEAFWYYKASDGSVKFHVYGDYFELPAADRVPDGAAKK